MLRRKTTLTIDLLRRAATVLVVVAPACVKQHLKPNYRLCQDSMSSHGRCKEISEPLTTLGRVVACCHDGVRASIPSTEIRPRVIRSNASEENTTPRHPPQPDEITHRDPRPELDLTSLAGPASLAVSIPSGMEEGKGGDV